MFTESPWDDAEIALLSSMNRQLITYENGKTLLGNADNKWDIPPGIFHMKHVDKLYVADFNITERPFSVLSEDPVKRK